MAGPKSGTTWRGRMLSRSIADSKKLAEVSERSALIYLLLLPRHDGEGTIEADDVSMLVGCARFALSRSWMASDMEIARGDMVAAGLWRMSEGPHGVVAEYVGWEEHQRLDRIGRGSRIAPDSNATPMAEMGGVVEEMPNHSPEVKRREVEHEEKRSRSEVARARVAPSVPETGGSITSINRSEGPELLANRLTRLWKKLHADRNLPCPKSPMFEADTIAHDRADAFAFFPTDELLLAEIRRTAACLDEKDYPVTFKGVMNQVGMSFPGTTDPEPALLVPEKHEVGLAPAIREMVTPLLKRGM